MDFYRDKQSGRVVTESEMLSMVDEDDNLDPFYLIGDFPSRGDALMFLNPRPTCEHKRTYVAVRHVSGIQLVKCSDCGQKL